MDFDLTHKRAVVGGSTQGIGRAVAEALAGLGCSVTLLARDAVKLQEVCAALPVVAGQQHDYLVADFGRLEEVRAVIGQWAAARTEAHILVNNTGGPPGGPITEATTEAFAAAFAQHLQCNQILAQALLPLMRRAGWGRIVNVISTSVKQPIPGLGVSNTIRAAVANWAKTLSLEVAPHGITVNNVLPGATDTQRLRGLIEQWAARDGIAPDEMVRRMEASIPARRFATPAEVAAAVVFLASPAAAYVNGINLPVDGGRTGNL
ncbi:MAG: SDR family oxidoreductase [Catalinimonas sp.]